MSTTDRACATLVDRLEENALLIPDTTAYRFLCDDGAQQAITFRDLNRRVQAVAAALEAKFDAGERSLLLFTPGLDFIVGFLGSLAAGLIAVPANVPHKNRATERLKTVLVDSDPAVVLTCDALREQISQQLPINELRHPVTTTGELEKTRASLRRGRVVDPRSIAFLQYTSGSTEKPRGVAITHANLIFNEHQITHSFQQKSESLMVSWLPLFHDMGLIGCVLQPLFVGYEAVLLSPLTFLRNPVSWLKAISDFRATTTGAPNFAYEHCVRTITPSQKRDLDLSSLEIAFNASEPIRYETLERFTEAFKQCGFRREMFFLAYGLAEATVFVSGGPPLSSPQSLTVCARALEEHQVRSVPPDSHTARRLMSCGLIAKGTDVAIVDPDSRLVCTPTTVGEIWISSESVAKGYWNQVEASQNAFEARLSEDDGKRYLRTGDTGIIHDGAIFVVGRIKDIIIVRGRKVYPQDIERAVETALAIERSNSVAAFALENDEGEGVGLMIENDREPVAKADASASAARVDNRPKANRLGQNETIILDRVREAVAREFDVAVHAVYFVEFGAFPRTSSGKLQRRLCRAALTRGTLPITLSWTAASGSLRPGSQSEIPT
jgi:acyl-CoA synthetase (AMP-forming)/AMP-acid ligase II